MSGSMDLVTLFIVNQIAAKKENKDPPKVAVFGSSKRPSQHMGSGPLVLPMSPCTPSELSLVESQSQYRTEETRNKPCVTQQEFKCQQLSPVVESAFSDHSASDYLPAMTQCHSPFSSTSSSSSRRGVFPLQFNLQQRNQKRVRLCSPRPWDTSGLNQTQPRGIPDSVPWSCDSNPPLYKLETPGAAKVLFGSPQQNQTDHTRHNIPFCVDHPGDREPALDFALSQLETEQQTEDDVFRGFRSEDCEREAHSNSSCAMNEWDCSHNHSCTSFLCSDSNDEDECCVQATSSYKDRACCAHSLNRKQRPHQPRISTPILKPALNTKVEQEIGENVVMGSTSQQVGTHTAPQSPSELCRCKKPSSDTRDTGTQTADNPRVQTCDASTQCLLGGDNSTEGAGLKLLLSPVDVSVQHPATGWQTATAVESNPYSHSTDEESIGKHTPWSKKKSTRCSLSGSSVKNKSTAANSDGHALQQTPRNTFLDRLQVLEGRERTEPTQGKEDGGLMKDHSSEVRKEVTSASRVDGPSEEAETLQEIASILLLLKHRRK
ncbi:uncharacterized protein V6R79_023799 [Siganus canaliculatus]